MKYHFILDNKKRVSVILYNRMPKAKIQIKVGAELYNWSVTFIPNLI